jgi:hypothetical protein
MEGKVMLICLEEIRLKIRSNGCTVRRFGPVKDGEFLDQLIDL